MNNLFDKKNFQKNPISYIYSLSQSNLESIVKTLDDNYYNGSSIVSDNEYDLIIDFIKNNYPDSEILNKTGHVVNSTKKIKLPTFLGSMDKVKKIDSWVKKYPDEWIISDKLDGISLLLTNNKAFTRGNGIEGQDISWILYYIDNSKISTDMIRGELIVSKKNWEIIKAKYPDFSNPRNFVSGIISRKEQNKELISYLDFIGYEYITEEPILIEDQMIKIQEKGLKCVTYKKFTEISNESISKYLLKRRENGDYEIDGVIICHNKKKYKDPNYTLKYMFVFLKHERSLRYTAVSGSGSGMGSGSNIVYIAVNKSSRREIREIKTSVIHVLLNSVSGTFGLECTNHTLG